MKSNKMLKIKRKNFQQKHVKESEMNLTGEKGILIGEKKLNDEQLVKQIVSSR